MRKMTLTIALLLSCSSLLAQTATTAQQTETGESTERRGDRTEDDRVRRRREAARPQWSFDVRLSSLYDSNVTLSRNEIGSYGLEGAAVARYQNRRSWPTWTAEYGIAQHWYGETERWNRTSHNLRVASIRRWNDRRFRFETVGQVQIKGWTVDRELADIYLVSPRFDWLPNNRNRLRVAGAFRWKKHDGRRVGDDFFDEGSDAYSPYMGLEYRRSFAASDHYFDASVRLEANNARDDGDSYRRTAYGIGYVAPFGERDRIELALDYRDRDWEQRRVATGARRHDRRWTPSATWIHEITDRLRIEADYAYDRQLSNEPRRDYDAHRLGITTRYRW
jgi:hypothetical protein